MVRTGRLRFMRVVGFALGGIAGGVRFGFASGSRFGFVRGIRVVGVRCGVRASDGRGYQPAVGGPDGTAADSALGRLVVKA